MLVFIREGPQDPRLILNERDRLEPHETFHREMQQFNSTLEQKGGNKVAVVV